MTTHAERIDTDHSGRTVGVRATCIAGAVLAAATFPLVGNTLKPEDGVTTTALLEDASGRLQVAGVIGVLGAAALFLAATLLADALPGLSGRVARAAGGAVALLFAVYAAVFASGGVVAGQFLDDPGPGVGEAMLVVLNTADFARYAPSLALVAAALLARAQLPRTVTLPAALLALMIIVPITTWLGALLTPIWLGVSAAVLAGSRPAQVP